MSLRLLLRSCHPGLDPGSLVKQSRWRRSPLICFYPAGLADICRDQLESVIYFNYLVLRRVVLLAERDNVPTAVCRIGFLDVRADQIIFNTHNLRAISRNCLIRIVQPMLKPASAFTCFWSSAVNVLDFHYGGPFSKGFCRREQDRAYSFHP
jgi:hypothetical protein